MIEFWFLGACAVHVDQVFPYTLHIQPHFIGSPLAAINTRPWPIPPFLIASLLRRSCNNINNASAAAVDRVFA